MKTINAVITDLDDTLWDWVNMWYNSFNPFINRIAKETSIPLQDLKTAFKKLHKKYHTSEASFLIDEIEILTSEQKELLKNNGHESISIMHEYYHNKKHYTKLYEGVKDTLERFKEIGTKVIGFTESKSFYTKYRMKTTGLDGYIDVIYTPEDHSLPENHESFYDKGYWNLEETTLKLLHGEFKKPDKKILLEILKNEEIDKDKALYVGDKIQRDVYMANQVELTSVHAKYGHVIDDERYELLKEVTHWTDNEVAIEKSFREKMKGKEINPFCQINAYEELLEKFNFISWTRQ